MSACDAFADAASTGAFKVVLEGAKQAERREPAAAAAGPLVGGDHGYADHIQH
jgi:hypothetical protein